MEESKTYWDKYSLTNNNSIGAELIAKERQRQVEKEGWSPNHDDEHDNHELAKAAACYSTPSHLREMYGSSPMLWPWDGFYWKPSPEDRIKELTKAGALIAAEIDRLSRLTPSEQKQ